MKKQYSALDFYGGKRVVLGRMDSLARQKLRDVPDDWRKHIYAELRENKGSEKFIEFLDGKRKIDFKTFDMLKDSYLEMKIDDILGEPVFSTWEIRNYWINQLHENPMVIGGDTPENPIDKNAELRFYVKLRAIAELYRDCNKSEQSLALAV